MVNENRSDGKSIAKLPHKVEFLVKYCNPNISINNENFWQDILEAMGAPTFNEVINIFFKDADNCVSFICIKIHQNHEPNVCMEFMMKVKRNCNCEKQHLTWLNTMNMLCHKQAGVTYLKMDINGYVFCYPGGRNFT